MRVYLPTTLTALACLLHTGAIEPAPVRGFAVTPALREWYATGDLEELEYVAMAHAARASLRLLADDPQAPRRRVVLAADVPDEEVVRRLSGRRVCVKAGHNYHVEFDPPKHEGVCDQDGSRLIQRDDDQPDVIRNRLRVYHEKTSPLIVYYDEQGLMRRIDGTRPQDEVHDHIRAVIATLRLEENV